MVKSIVENMNKLILLQLSAYFDGNLDTRDLGTRATHEEKEGFSDTADQSTQSMQSNSQPSINETSPNIAENLGEKQEKQLKTPRVRARRLTLVVEMEKLLIFLDNNGEVILDSRNNDCEFLNCLVYHMYIGLSANDTQVCVFFFLCAFKIFFRSAGYNAPTKLLCFCGRCVTVF